MIVINDVSSALEFSKKNARTLVHGIEFYPDSTVCISCFYMDGLLYGEFISYHVHHYYVKSVDVPVHYLTRLQLESIFGECILDKTNAEDIAFEYH